MKYEALKYCLAGILLAVKIAAAVTHEVKPQATPGSLSEAVMHARHGDTLIVRPGIYLEQDLVIDKKLVLRGVGFPVIDGSAKHEILKIVSDSVEISGFVIRNAGISFIHDNAGLKIEDAKYCVIRDNRFRDNFFAVYLSNASDCLVEDNLISGKQRRESQSANGIHLWYCKNITIRNNRVEGHRDGIYFEFVQNSIIENNICTKNNRYGLHFMFSDRCRYINNQFTDNGAGVAVMYTKHVDMTANRFSNNWGPASYGLLLKDISDSQIRDNLFLNNTTGIYLEATNRVVVEQNTLRGNGWAIRLMANSMDNRFTANTFLTNSFDVSTNSRQNFSRFENNFWDNYSGYDLDRDGFGDIPHRPVTLFGFIAQQQPASLILLRGLFIRALNFAEKVMPSLAPPTLVDKSPRVRRPQ